MDSSESQTNNKENVLVTRPMKDMLWDDGKVFLKYQRIRFKKNKMPSVKRIQKFLEHEQAKDIVYIDDEKFKTNTIYSSLMVCTGMTPRHISRIAYSLLKALKEAEIPNYEMMKVLGTRDSGFMILTIQGFHIHFLTEEMRPELNVEDIWKKETTGKDIEETLYDYYEMYKIGKRKKR